MKTIKGTKRAFGPDARASCSLEQKEERIDQQEGREALEDMKTTGSRPWDEVKKELGI